MNPVVGGKNQLNEFVKPSPWTQAKTETFVGPAIHQIGRSGGATCTHIKLNFARLPEINLRAGKSRHIGARGPLLYLKLQTIWRRRLCADSTL